MGNIPDHGTRQRYLHHIISQDTPCDACKAAHAAYHRDYYHNVTLPRRAARAARLKAAQEKEEAKAEKSREAMQAYNRAKKEREEMIKEIQRYQASR